MSQTSRFVTRIKLGASLSEASPELNFIGSLPELKLTAEKNPAPGSREAYRSLGLFAAADSKLPACNDGSKGPP